MCPKQDVPVVFLEHTVKQNSQCVTINRLLSFRSQYQLNSRLLKNVPFFFSHSVKFDRKPGKRGSFALPDWTNIVYPSHVILYLQTEWGWLLLTSERKGERQSRGTVVRVQQNSMSRVNYRALCGMKIQSNGSSADLDTQLMQIKRCDGE